MKKSNKIVAVLLALVMIISAVPMMTVSADVGGFGDAIFGKDEDKHEHVYVIQSVEEGSCTEVAKTTFKCGCGDVQVLTSGEPAHTPAIGGYVNKDEDVHTNYCTVCKKVFEEKHTYEKVDAECVDSTCKAAGKDVYKCSICGAKKTVALEPSVHTPSGKVVSSADKHGFTCSACEKLIDENHVWDEGTPKAGVACGDNGKIIYKCEVEGCNATKEDTVPAACVYPDKKEINDDNKIDKFDDKNHTFECIYCSKDKVETHEYVVKYAIEKIEIGTEMVPDPVTGGSIEVPVYANKVMTPTCTEEGKIIVSCKYCKYSYSATVDTVDHKIAENAKYVKFSEDKHKTTCEFCGEVKLPHTWDEGKVTKAPTCKEEGTKTVTCKDCGQTKTEAIAKTTEHTWGEWEVVEEATTEKEGKKTRKCSVCEATETEKIDKLTAKLGDVNGDGSITAVDARIVLQNVAGLKPLTEKEKEAADMNADGNITAVDARVILQKVAAGE